MTMRRRLEIRVSGHESLRYRCAEKSEWTCYSCRPITVHGPQTPTDHLLPSPLLHSLLPIVGQYEISDVAKMTIDLHKQYGKIVRLGGLIGRPDLLFVNDADEIEKVRGIDSPLFRQLLESDLEPQIL